MAAHRGLEPAASDRNVVTERAAYDISGRFESRIAPSLEEVLG